VAAVKDHDDLFYINRSILDPTSNSDPSVKAGSVQLERNLGADARFEVNARGIIRRDDKPQTSYEERRNQRANFYALKRCLRDARRARARSVLRDPFKRISILSDRH